MTGAKRQETPQSYAVWIREEIQDYETYTVSSIYELLCKICDDFDTTTATTNGSLDVCYAPIESMQALPDESDFEVVAAENGSYRTDWKRFDTAMEQAIETIQPKFVRIGATELVRRVEMFDYSAAPGREDKLTDVVRVAKTLVPWSAAEAWQTSCFLGNEEEGAVS